MCWANDEAVALLQRALAIRETKATPARALAETRFVLAKALWSSKSERARAIELAKQAVTGLRGAGPPSADMLADAERWLRDRAGRR